MIKAYKAGYLKFDKELTKRRGHYLIIEMTVKSMPFIHLIIIGQDGLVYAQSITSITEITGFHRYIATSQENLGAGELTPLDTNHKNGMLEGLSAQIGFNYQQTATAFGEALLKVSGF
jgi:hypothetical protein